MFISAAAAPFILFAGLEGRADIARGFTITLVLGAFLGGVTLAGTRNVHAPARASAALRLAFFGWLLSPLLAAPPLVAATGSFPAGVFEAYSALTTTGSIIVSPEEAGVSITLWRCVLAWLGGLGSLVLAATVFAALDRRGVGLRRTYLLTVEHSDLFTNFGRALRRFGAIYVGLTLTGFMLLLLTGTPPFDSLCLALSGLATSGLTPRSDALGLWMSPASQGVLALICLSGAWNMAVQYDLASRRRITRGSGELRAILVLGLGAGLYVALRGHPGMAYSGALDMVFAVTTAGFQTQAVPVLPLMLLVMVAMAGGSTISTSGGIKMPRILLLLRRAGGELSSLSHPSAAVRTRFIGRPVSDSALAGVWVYALAFPAALGLGAVALGVSGMTFQEALMVSAASLVNAGPLSGVDYATLPPLSLVVSAFIMVLGRLEVLAAAAAIYVIFARD
ncbi:TrkH family potassium uptake protein [Oceanicaulis sp. LC35]|uniref:TrkH family potassium uptake protein n=1 Tax=Oceanicaulis sp. LC35 TaxID=3349635 RepID=UPI003F83C006